MTTRLDEMTTAQIATLFADSGLAPMECCDIDQDPFPGLYDREPHVEVPAYRFTAAARLVIAGSAPRAITVSLMDWPKWLPFEDEACDLAMEAIKAATDEERRNILAQDFTDEDLIDEALDLAHWADKLIAELALTEKYKDAGDAWSVIPDR